MCHSSCNKRGSSSPTTPTTASRCRRPWIPPCVGSIAPPPPRIPPLLWLQREAPPAVLRPGRKPSPLPTLLTHAHARALAHASPYQAELYEEKLAALARAGLTLQSEFRLMKDTLNDVFLAAIRVIRATEAELPIAHRAFEKHRLSKEVRGLEWLRPIVVEAAPLMHMVLPASLPTRTRASCSPFVPPP